MGNFNPKLPTKFRGTDKTITFFVTRNREPTLADFRQPETGNLYSIATIWQVGKNPSTGVEGDLWILSKIVANQAYWVKIATGVIPTAGILEIAVDASSGTGTNPVQPDVNGLVTVTGAQVATGIIGANVIRMNSKVVNSYTAEIQQTAAVSSKDTTKNGVAHFNSNQFSVDQGFTSLTGNNSTQPAFYAQVITPSLNVTGDSTVYQVIFANEIFDQTNSYNNATGVFTAPSAGKYLFTGSVLLNAVNNVLYTESYISLNTTQRNFVTNQIAPGKVYSENGTDFQVSLSFNVFCQMSANDTATVTISVGPAGPKTVSVGSGGSTDPRTWFSACKLC